MYTLEMYYSQVFQTMALVPRGGTPKKLYRFITEGKKCLCLVILKPSSVNKEVFALSVFPVSKEIVTDTMSKTDCRKIPLKVLLLEQSWVYC